jgi:lipopolysaccharide transport system ATP-binding protein
MEPAIVVEKLSKEYRIGQVREQQMLRDRIVSLFKSPFAQNKSSSTTVMALRDVTFDVRPGEVLGIIGRNGAGKSTLLKVLSKITYPTSGRVSVAGRVASLLEVGTGFHDELTGRENILLNGSILGMSKAEVTARFDEIVAFAGTGRFIDTPIKRYSSGMRMRLGFAVAAHLNPEVLIVDEVLAVGDAGFQKRCLDAMDGLRSGGRTVLFVSHNMAAVENLCSRCLWIEDGAIRQDGAVKDVIEAYMATSAGGATPARDLRSSEGRRGSGEIRYTGFELLDREGCARSFVRCGDPITLRFQYHADAPIPHPSFGCRLYTELGTLVTETSFWHHRFDLPLLSAGDGVVDVEIRALNLLPARYYLSLWLTGPGGKLYDAIEHCIVLDVEVTDVYGSGRAIEGRHGIVYLPHQWKLNGSYLRTPDAEKPR